MSGERLIGLCTNPDSERCWWEAQSVDESCPGDCRCRPDFYRIVSDIEKAENERDEAVEAADRLLSEREAAVTTAERLVGDVKLLVAAARDAWKALDAHLDATAAQRSDNWVNGHAALSRIHSALKPFEEGER